MLVVPQRRLYPRPSPPIVPVSSSWGAIDCSACPARPIEALCVNVQVKDFSESAERLSDLAEFTPEGGQPSRRAHAAGGFIDLLTRKDATYKARCASEPGALRVMGGLSNIPPPQDGAFEATQGPMPSTCVVLEGIEDDEYLLVGLRVWLLVISPAHSVSRSVGRWLKLNEAVAHVEAAKTEEKRRTDDAKRQRLGVVPPSGPKAAARFVCSTAHLMKRTQWYADAVASEACPRRRAW